MVLIKVVTESDSRNAKQIRAYSYRSLKKKCEKKFKIKIYKFLNKKDDAYIDNNKIFIEELELAARDHEKLELVAIEASDDKSSRFFLTLSKAAISIIYYLY